MRARTYFYLISVVWSISACGHSEMNMKESPTVLAVQPVGNDLAYVQSDGVVQRLNVMSGAPTATTTKTTITSNPRLVVKRPGASADSTVDELLIVSDGKNDEYGQELEKPALTVLAASGYKRVYTLDDSGQQMRISEDGKFAILFNDPSFQDTTSLLSNPGEVAIIDLTSDGLSVQAPIIRNLDTVGGPPNSVSFPQLTIGSETRRFAFFTFPNGVSLIDLAHPREAGHKLDLTGWLPSGGISPEAGFAIAANAESNEIYLKTNSSKFVETVTVLPSTTQDGGVDISLKQLTVGTTPPGAIDVYSSDAGTQLVATLHNAVALVATEEDTVTTVGLRYAANKILRFQSTAPDDPTIKQRALLYSQGQVGVTFANLESLAKEGDRALQVVDFGQSISEIRQVQFMEDQVLVFLSGGGVDILDLASRRWVPIDSPVPLALVVADSERSRVWVSNPGDTRIAYLDFGADPSDAAFTVKKKIQLDDEVRQFFRVDGLSHSRVVAVHDQVGGAVTLLDAQNPERSSAKKLEGFLFSNLFD